MRFGQRIEQVAYVVNDVRKAALMHAKLYGSGPFFIIDNVQVAQSWHRGKESPLEASAALGQSGDVMVELLSSSSDAPSMINDLYPHGSGKQGIHHFCYHVDNLQQAAAEFERAGFETVAKIRMLGGTDVVIADTHRVYGHYVEFYEKTPEIKVLYDALRKAAVGFDGRNPLRSFEELDCTIKEDKLISG